jgi:hypothetical protein
VILLGVMGGVARLGRALVSPVAIGSTAFAVALAAALVYGEARVLARREDQAATLLAAAHATQALASGIVACSDRAPAGVPRTLPPASRSVPASLPRGGKVPTTEADWADAAFECADFRLLEPQGFQLRWALTPPSESYVAAGIAKAAVDLDGDGLVDHVVETGVACSRDFCTLAPTAHVERP